jgi:hypothetical protein
MRSILSNQDIRSAIISLIKEDWWLTIEKRKKKDEQPSIVLSKGFYLFREIEQLPSETILLALQLIEQLMDELIKLGIAEAAR